MSLIDRRFRLADPAGPFGLECDAEGGRLAGAPLLVRTLAGFAPRCATELDAIVKAAYGQSVDGTRLISGLSVVADALNRGDIGRAMIAAVQLRLSAPGADGAGRVRKAQAGLAKYSSEQPRDWHGRWTEGDTDPAPAQSNRNSGSPQASTPEDNATFATSDNIVRPTSPSQAPPAISFSAALQSEFDALWAQSFPDGRSLERGGDIVSSIQNLGGLRSDSSGFVPNLVLSDPLDYGVVGIFHTHPYSTAEGGYTGVSLTGGDAAVLILSRANFIVAQSGDQQFMFLPTNETPSNVDYHQLNDQQNDRIGRLYAEGLSFPIASQQAALETAKTYHLAYYEVEKGRLRRVYP